MEHSIRNKKAAIQRPHLKNQGFALISLLTLIPLFAAVVLGLAWAHSALRKKSLAQSRCIFYAMNLQSELGQTLTALLRMNPRAQQLRKMRDEADKLLQEAIETAFPPAIAAATAYWGFVVEQQLAFRAEQQKLLAEAAETRLRYDQELRQKIRDVGEAFRSHHYMNLAVRPTPFLSLSPDYETLPAFANLQSHDFTFDVDLEPRGGLPFFEDLMGKSRFRQKVACTTTLEKKGRKWQPRIVAANPSSNWPSFSWF